MTSDDKCLNCGVRIDSANDVAVARLNQERAIFRQQQIADHAKIRSLEKKLFDINQDLEKARNDSMRFQEMRDENMSLSKDILILGEMCNRAQEKLEAMNSNHFLRASQISDRTKIKALERELDRERLMVDNRTRERDWFRGRCNELEELMVKKEGCITECRKLIECNHNESKAKLETQSERINALNSIKKQLMDRILVLNRKSGTGPVEPRRKFLFHLVLVSLMPLFAEGSSLEENGSDQDTEVYVDLS